VESDAERFVGAGEYRRYRQKLNLEPGKTINHSNPKRTIMSTALKEWRGRRAGAIKANEARKLHKKCINTFFRLSPVLGAAMLLAVSALACLAEDPLLPPASNERTARHGDGAQTVAPSDRKEAAPADAPPDDPAAVAALRENWLVSLRLNAQGNVEKLDCEGIRGSAAMMLMKEQKLNEEQIKARHLDAMKRLAGLHSLRDLRVYPVSAGELAYVKGLTSLQRLETSGPYAAAFGLDNPIDDAALVNLRGLNNLKALVLSRAKGVTDAGLKNLAPLTKLRLLDLSKTSVRGAGLKYLGNLDLRWVYLSNTPVGDDGIAGVLAFHNLLRLDFDGTQLTDKSLPLLAKLPRKTDANVSRTQVTRRGVYSTPGAREVVHAGKFVDDLNPEAYGEAGGPMGQAGKKAPLLGASSDARDDAESAGKLRAAEHVSCQFDEKGENITVVGWSAGVKPQLLAHIAGLHHLRELYLDAKFADDDVACLESLKSLRTLDLSGTRVSDAGLKAIRNLTNLEALWLPKSRYVTDAGLANMASLTELDSLYLDDTGVHGEGLKHLQKMKKLRRLSLANTQVDDDAMPVIASLSSVAHLDLAGTKLTDDGLRNLSGLSRLTWLDLFDTKTTRAGGERLRTKLPKLGICYPISQRKDSELLPEQRKND
jgi:hypothetical protein